MKRSVVALSIVGIVMASALLVGIVRAGTVSFNVPLNSAGITVNAVASNPRTLQGPNLLFDLTLTACSQYNADTLVSARIGVFSDANFDNYTQAYARVKFHQVTIPANGCTTITQTVRVTHATNAAADTSAYVVTTAVVQRDGVAISSVDTEYVNLAYWMQLLLA